MCGRKTLISAIPLRALANFCAWRVVSPARTFADAMADAPGKRHGIDDLLGVIARLRDPETGCPWDVEQNFGTMTPYTIEEAYEVADAIARGDMDGLKDELGDLLSQVVYDAAMAS